MAAFGSPQSPRPDLPLTGGTTPETVHAQKRGGPSYRATPDAKGTHMPSTTARVPAGPLTRSRNRDPLTSTNAGAAITPLEQTKVKDAIEAILADLGPLTDEDIYAEYVKRGYPRRTATRVRTARSEMHKLDTPTRIRAARLPDVKLASGHFAQRWELIPDADDEAVAA